MKRELVVGIDLGTTNSCLAWAVGDAEIGVFGVPQLAAGGRGRERRALLPSVLYAPAPGEDLAEPLCAPPWITGELARERGKEVPGRAVTSAKSWLGHPSKDPEDPILPWPSSEGAPRISPVDASARYLAHLARAFEEATGERLQDAHVVLTVPASFDDGARSSTLAAARRAGLDPALLEEPQAAFYDYMAAGGGRSLEDLLDRAGPARGAARVLVVDVGGGTTDLSFMAVSRRAGALHVERLATGDHLLLGGDNMDLALAAVVRERIGQPLDAAREGRLVLACRGAKELLLGDRAPDAAPIAIAARGSKLVGKTLRAEIAREDAERVVLDGFFPRVARGELPRHHRAGLVSEGLPYARDPAITRHVAQFLEKYAGGELPDAILLNGGVFRARAIRRRVADVIASWSGAPVCVLQESHPDLAVARGAARYARVRATGGLRVSAGAPRSYYVGVGHAAGGAAAVCVIPRGTAEGARCEVRGVPLKLRTGEPARFDLYRAETGVAHPVGAVVDVSGRDYARLRPLVTRAPGAPGTIDVELAGELSPVGTLALSLVERGGKRRAFSLEFTVHNATPVALPAPEVAPPPPRARLEEAARLVARAMSFAEKDARGPKDLVRDLERLLGDRFGWHTRTARAIFDALIDERGARRWSEAHERVFWMLAGFCLRPGFGDPDDPARLRALCTLFAPALSFPDRAPGWQAFFIAWRRVAPGLGERESAALRDELDPALGLSPPRKGRPRPLAPDELRELAAWLERVPSARKISLGERLVDETRTSRAARLFEDTSRLGARSLVYADPRYVVPACVAEGWAEVWLGLDWAAIPRVHDAVVRLARVSGDPERDLSPSVRRAIAAKITRTGGTDAQARALTSFVPVSTSERRTSFGDALPIGLTLDP